MAWIETPNKYLNPAEMDNNALEVLAIMKSNGWSVESIAALCGNMRLESRINPLIRAYNVSGAFGLTQWTGTRKTALKTWCDSNGQNYQSGPGQCAYINHEREPGVDGWMKKPAYDRISMQDWSTNTPGWTVAQLTECFWDCYERSAGYDERRAEYAEHYYELFGESPDPPGPGPGPSPTYEYFWLLAKKKKWFRPGGRKYI